MSCMSSCIHVCVFVVSCNCSNGVGCVFVFRGGGCACDSFMCVRSGNLIDVYWTGTDGVCVWVNSRLSKALILKRLLFSLSLCLSLWFPIITCSMRIRSLLSLSSSLLTLSFSSSFSSSSSLQSLRKVLICSFKLSTCSPLPSRFLCSFFFFSL